MYKIEMTEALKEWGAEKYIVQNEALKLDSGIFRCDPGSSLPLHTHDDADEYCYVFAGKAVFVIENEEVEVGEGELIKIPRGALHRSYCISEEPMSSFFIVCP